MRTLEDLERCAKRCMTHFEACDCKQYEHRQQLAAANNEIERLKRYVPYKVACTTIEGMLKQWAVVMNPDYEQIIKDIKLCLGRAWSESHKEPDGER